LAQNKEIIAQALERITDSTDNDLTFHAISYLATLIAVDDSIAALIHVDILRQVVPVVDSIDPKVMLSGLGILLSLASRVPNITGRFIEADLIPELISFLYDGERAAKIKATQLFFGIVVGANLEQLADMVQRCFLDAFETMFTDRDADCLYMALEVYRVVFEKARKYRFLSDVIDMESPVMHHLDALCHHPNSVISDAAANLVDNFIVPFANNLDLVDMVQG
jgi:hypothetical protein